MFQMPGMDTPEGQGLLAAAFSLLQARKMPGDRGIGGALGAAGQQYMGTRSQAQDQMQRRKYQDAQMEAQQMQLEAARQRQMQEQRAEAERMRRDAYFRGIGQPQGPEQAMANGQGPTIGNAQRLGQPMQPDPMQVLRDLGPQGLEEFTKINSALNPARKFSAYKPGDVIMDESDPTKPVFSVPDRPDKPAELPSAVREYQFAVGQGYKGTFDQWNKDTKKAGATNIGMPKIDIKMGDSVAGQIGPMAKDSRVAVQGAVKMYDAADRIDKALSSNKVSAGPLSTQIQTVKQLVQKVAGGNDENIRQTQQVIRSLAQMAVEARKQLQGQGQVTDSEAKAVAKADAGDIDSMTTGELQDLVTLTKRASHFIAKGHQEMLDTMGTNDGTRGAVPFYRVPGMDTLLKHQPKLPQIGGNSGWAIQKE